jgi:hypothetical protein
MSILRADSIRDRAGTGAPDFPNGLTGNITGTATTATNAQGITGTPNITVGTVGCGNVTSSGNISATDATFSGNLTVNGTTTTIDTAVTSVDSLAVDGNVTALGNLGVGTATAGNALHVFKNGDGQTPVFFETSNATGKLRFYNDSNGWSIDSEGELRFVGGRTGSGAPVSLHITSGGAAIFKGGLAEKYNSISGNLASNTNHSIFNGNVIAFAVGDTGTSLTINFTDVHATLSQHEFCSFTVILDPGGAGKITTVQIDGQSPAGGLKWSGGSAPSAGASGYDVYTFALQKYGTAANNYVVYGAATNYD